MRREQRETTMKDLEEEDLEALLESGEIPEALGTVKGK